MEEICICIPVRYGSSRLPGKPLFKLGDKTVIEWTLQRVFQSKLVRKEQVYVFTDDQRIADVVMAAGVGGVVMTDSDCPNAVYRLSRYVDQLPERFKVVVNLHGDEPLLDVRNLDCLLSAYLEKPEPKILVSVLEPEDVIRHSQPKIVFDLKGYLMYVSRIWIPHTKFGKLPENHVYYGLAGIHMLDREQIKLYDQAQREDGAPWLYQLEDTEELKYIEMGIKIKCVIAPHIAKPSLNTQEDYDYIKGVMSKKGEIS